MTTLQQQFEQELIQTQIEVQETTRKHLASELHDNIGQLLSLTNVTLASINITDTEKAEQKITDTQNLVTKSIQELRQLSKIIHGEQIIRQGLIQTIEQEIAWLQRNGVYTITFNNTISHIETSNADKDLFLYRLLQESLNNIIKHSGADTINISLLYNNQSLQLVIEDNGNGFNVAEKIKEQSGMGLVNMQKRINLLKGNMQINSAENKGTTISFNIPYP
jgi:signal transduction histidine kinase